MVTTKVGAKISAALVGVPKVKREVGVLSVRTRQIITKAARDAFKNTKGSYAKKRKAWRKVYARLSARARYKVSADFRKRNAQACQRWAEKQS